MPYTSVAIQRAMDVKPPRKEKAVIAKSIPPAGSTPVIVIGHPYPETIQALLDASKVFRKKGIMIIPVSQLMKKNTTQGAS